MNLKESKGNMYEFITHTWNPMGGRCPASCRRLASSAATLGCGEI